MDPAVVGKFKMTPLESNMASDLKKAAEANDSVGVCVVRVFRLPARALYFAAAAAFSDFDPQLIVTAPPVGAS